MDQPVQRYKLRISYRGTKYYGWQTQGLSIDWKGTLLPDGSQPPTIQVICRRAIEKVVGHHVKLVGSSRTDSGVHAKGQVATFDTHMTNIPIEGLRRAVNSRLPPDIVIGTIEPCAAGFDVIRHTDRKRYQYVIWNAPDPSPFFGELAFHRWQPLDLAAMSDAAGQLQGEHDFNAFAKPGHGRLNTVRTVHECSVHGRGPKVVIGVTGSGFLWNMVRIIAGTLVEVGSGRFKPEDIGPMLRSRDRALTGSTAPAHGLYLQWVRFKVEQNTPLGGDHDQQSQNS
ncbi:MAG: tRNA pseudouridine(38-40) synthase TruA [Burkholderiales bacterium]|nr:tRNA pseudouridine(38-40) synthase TruA [Phycisphaerae bacterium]